MKIFEYKDYEDYKTAQVEANKEKLDYIWVTNHSMDEIFKRSGPFVSRILCHGTRNGAEQTLFGRRYRSAEILGTEISDTAKEFKNTIQWDFMEQKEEWIGKWDIVYSNSIDHCTDPVKTIRTWIEQLHPSIGKLYIDHGNNKKTGTNQARRWDPLEIDDKEMEEQIKEAGGRIVETFVGKGCFRKTHQIFDDVRFPGEPTRIYMIQPA